LSIQYKFVIIYINQLNNGKLYESVGHKTIGPLKW